MEFDFHTATLIDIDVLDHTRTFEAHHDDGECDTTAIVKVTLRDKTGFQLEFFCSAKSVNHSDSDCASEIHYYISREEYPDVLINGIPEHNRLELGTCRLFIDTNNIGVWQHQVKNCLLNRDVDEIIFWDQA